MPLPLNQVPDTMQYAALPTFPNGSLYAGVYTLIFRVRRKSNMQIVKEHRLIQMPMRIQQTTDVRTALYYTKGGPAADTPRATGVGMTMFTITGHTGFWGIRNDQPTPGPPRDDLGPVEGPEVPQGTRGPVATSLIDGAAAIKDLQDTILAYFFPQGQPETQGVTQTQDLQLEFLNLTAPTSHRDRTGRVGWIIYPQRTLVDIQQEAPKPFLYTYTLTFAALAPLAQDIPDRWEKQYVDPRTGLQTPQELLALAGKDTVVPVDELLQQEALEELTGHEEIEELEGHVEAPGGLIRSIQSATATLRRLTDEANTIRRAFEDMLIQGMVLPVMTFVNSVRDLSDAVADFIDVGTGFVGVAQDTILFPLYAARDLTHVLDAPTHSVSTLIQASRELGDLLMTAADPRNLGALLGVEETIAGLHDELTLAINGEDPVKLTLPPLVGGPAIAAAIQDGVRDTPPAHSANAGGYRDFTASFTDGRYVLSSGTKGSDAASVHVVEPVDAPFEPRDASAALKVGVSSGAQEQQGSATPNKALALLRGVEQACTHLLAFPDYFADQLETQDAALAARLSGGVTRPQIRGDQRIEQVRITPGESLQGIGARVGVPWETLALVNRLTYPFIVEEPTFLTRGRVDSATLWSLTDTSATWTVNAYQGQLVAITGGAGAGQTRRLVRNTATALTLETAWTVVPNDTSDYAILSADNPVVFNGTVTSATMTTVTDSSLTLVPGARRGLSLVLTTGPSAGERRQVLDNSATIYTLEAPWDVVPTAGSLYALMGAGPGTRRVKLVGDRLGVPRPSAQTGLPIRSRLQDVSAMTGKQRSVEEQLFGRDLFLDGQTMALVFDAVRQDMVTIAELPNLRQAIIHYINLPLGDLDYAPGLGSFVQEEIGLTATLPSQIQLLQSVERTIRQDPRVAAMDAAQLVTQGGRAVMTFGVRAINGASISRVVIR